MAHILGLKLEDKSVLLGFIHKETNHKLQGLKVVALEMFALIVKGKALDKELIKHVRQQSTREQVEFVRASHRSVQHDDTKSSNRGVDHVTHQQRRMIQELRFAIRRREQMTNYPHKSKYLYRVRRARNYPKIGVIPGREIRT